MKNTKKYLKIFTSIIVGIGGLSGYWAGYTAYKIEKFKEPFTKHDELAKSYVAEIKSMEKRKAIKEADRLRIKYESFEESWRNQQKLASLVKPIENLSSSKLSNNELKEVKKLVALVNSEQPSTEGMSRTIGSAYFALGQYQEALAKYNKVANEFPNDPNIFALRAASYARLSKQEKNTLDQEKHKKKAIESLRKAISLQINKEKLSEYLNSDNVLRQVLDNDTEFKKLLSKH